MMRPYTRPTPRKFKHYRLGDALKAGEAQYFDVPRDSIQVMALFTGQIRPPRQGERYLQWLATDYRAYYALEDLPTPYPIVKLARVERRVILETIKTMPFDHFTHKEVTDNA